MNWNELLSTVMNHLMEIVFGVIGIYILPKLPKLTQGGIEWVNGQAKHVKNQYVSGILQRVSTLMGALVIGAENTMIEDLKAALADGKITKDELKGCVAHVKTQVLGKFKEHATVDGLLNTVLAIFGGNQEALDKYLEDLLEAHVAQLPPSGLQTPVDSGPVPPKDVPAVP